MLLDVAGGRVLGQQDMSVLAALSALGLAGGRGALLPVQCFSPPFGAGRMRAHRPGDLVSASLTVSVLLSRTL